MGVPVRSQPPTFQTHFQSESGGSPRDCGFQLRCFILWPEPREPLGLELERHDPAQREALGQQLDQGWER